MFEPLHIAEIAALLLASYVAGCGLGYGARRAVSRISARAAPDPVPAPSSARRLAAVVAREDVAPAPLQSIPVARIIPQGASPDNLQQIRGIGPKTESVLHELGILRFDQIAAWGEDDLNWLDGRVATKSRILREQWIEQATLAATRTQAAA